MPSSCQVATRAMTIAADMCVYTNHNFVTEVLDDAPKSEDDGEKEDAAKKTKKKAPAKKAAAKKKADEK